MQGPPPLPPVPPPPPLYTCPRCQHLSSGNFCTHCGASLHEGAESKQDPFISFASSFLNIGGISRWFKIFFFILKRPAANTIKMYNEIPFEPAMKFMEFSFGFYTLITAGKITFAALGERFSKQPLWKDIISEIIFLLFAIGGYLITLKLFYRFASRRYGHRNKRNYVKMYCLSAGFILPAMGIVYYVTGGLLNSVNFELPIYLLVFRVILLMTLGISSLVYGTFVWRYFWNAPNQKVFALLLWAGLISFVASFIVLIAIFWSLDIDLWPTKA